LLGCASALNDAASFLTMPVNLPTFRLPK
jgi:hypothetical protein